MAALVTVQACGDNRCNQRKGERMASVIGGALGGNPTKAMKLGDVEPVS
jgi:hypothetical protein